MVSHVIFKKFLSGVMSVTMGALMIKLDEFYSLLRHAQANIIPTSLILASLTLGACLLVRRKKKWLPVNDKAVLITGCDTGFGHEAAIQLDKLGFQVFAGCLVKDGEGEKMLKEQCSARLRTFEIDVTKPDHIETAYAHVTAELGDRYLWGLVNNAGVLYISEVEIMPDEYINRIIDINFMGMVRMTKKFLPLIRRAKGRVVFLASISGECPMRQMSIYCASKAAIKMFASVLRLDMHQWGVQVATICPGGFSTNLLKYDLNATYKKWFEQAPQMVQDDYGIEYATLGRKKNVVSDRASSLQPVIGSITDALCAQTAKKYYRPGEGAYIMPVLGMLPTIISDPILRKITDFFTHPLPKSLRGKQMK